MDRSKPPDRGTSGKPDEKHRVEEIAARGHRPKVGPVIAILLLTACASPSGTARPESTEATPNENWMPTPADDPNWEQEPDEEDWRERARARRRAFFPTPHNVWLEAGSLFLFAGEAYRKGHDEKQDSEDHGAEVLTPFLGLNYAYDREIGSGQMLGPLVSVQALFAKATGQGYWTIYTWGLGTRYVRELSERTRLVATFDGGGMDWIGTSVVFPTPFGTARSKRPDNHHGWHIGPGIGIDYHREESEEDWAGVGTRLSYRYFWASDGFDAHWVGLGVNGWVRF